MTNIQQLSPYAQAPLSRLKGSLSHRVSALYLPEPELYFDKVQVWLQVNITRKQEQILGSLCRPKPGRNLKRARAIKKRMSFHPEYRCRVHLFCPTREAIEYLIQLNQGNPVIINGLELACDWAGIDHRAAHEFLHKHMVRKYRRGQEVKLIMKKSEARYDGAPRKRSLTVLYLDDCCRTTGELDCLHFEWKLKTRALVQSIGVNKLEDLISFDHVRFWRERFSRYLAFYRVNYERLGRLVRNRATGSRTQKPQYYERQCGAFRYRVNLDSRLGFALACQHDDVQSLIACYGMSTLHPSLEPVAVLVQGINYTDVSLVSGA